MNHARFMISPELHVVQDRVQGFARELRRVQGFAREPRRVQGFGR
jgi:hypothetical protein